MSIKSLEKESIEEKYNNLIEKCREALSNNEFIIAYDYAVQAKFVAENFLENDSYIIESEMLRGVSYLKIDVIIGHDIIRNIYIKSLENIVTKTNNRLQIRLKNSLATAKRYLGEYDEALKIFYEILEISKKEIEEAKRKEDNYDSRSRGIIYCLVNITISLIFKSKQKNYPLEVIRIENRIKNMQMDDLNQIKEVLKRVHLTAEVSTELNTAEKHILEAIRLAEKYHFKDYELLSKLNYSCVLIEKDKYNEVIEILEQLKSEEYIINNILGNVLNELGLAYINIGKHEIGIELLNEAWIWLNDKKDFNELSRNIYATAVYHYKLGNLDMAYSYAELAFSRESDISSLKLLYEISLLKYAHARMHGNETKCALCLTEYEKYKEKIQRRA